MQLWCLRKAQNLGCIQANEGLSVGLRTRGDQQSGRRTQYHPLPHPGRTVVFPLWRLWKSDVESLWPAECEAQQRAGAVRKPGACVRADHELQSYLTFGTSNTGSKAILCLGAGDAIILLRNLGSPREAVKDTVKRTIQRALLAWMFYCMRNKPLMNRETANPKLVWNSEAWCHRIAYNTEMRKLYHFYSDWLLLWELLYSRELVKSGYLTPF